MKAMTTINILCPHCGHQIEYWTKNDTIYCPECKKGIPVEPCTEDLNTEVGAGAEEGAAEDEAHV